MASGIPGYERLGFSSNPFIHSLADDEPQLPEYYLKPPYFEHIFGEPHNQTSRIIFGEFGCGKTALRKHIEDECRRMSPATVLCITYDNFPYLNEGKAVKAVTLKIHIDELLKRLTVALLFLINDHGPTKLTTVQRGIARWLVHKYYESLTPAEVESCCKSVSTVPEHYWRKFKENRGTIVNLLKLGLNALFGMSVDLELPNLKETYREFDSNSLLLLQKTYDLFEVYGIKSVVVLIDNVDQAGPNMQEPDNIIAFLKPVLFNYNLLCMQDFNRTRQVYGFKILLPLGIEMKSKLKRQKFRFDRVLDNTIEWRVEEMQSMWGLRLRHYSNRQIDGLRRFCDDKDIDDKIISAASGVPRHMIIYGQRILEEYDRLETKAPTIPTACTELAFLRLKGTLPMY